MLIPETLSNIHPRDTLHYGKSVSRERLNAWIGLCGNGDLAGPYFFEGDLNGESYLEMFNHFVIPQLSLTYIFDFNRF